MGRQKPREVLEAIDALPEHVHVQTTRVALSRIAENYPKKAAALVAEMETGATRKYSASSLVGVWLSQDQKATIDWTLNEPAIQGLRHFLLENTLYRIAHVNTRLAMDTALEQPFTEGEMGLEGEVVGVVAVSDLDTAI
ncbi:MAG: hypothetical protein F4X44_02385 [Gammaproteobacteria bacterium]|nr:hypothetical protein [Gammaproteobacteria bacterium]MYD79442.1 hypothetical protein [Gammaproteobacteria bacterium]